MNILKGRKLARNILNNVALKVETENLQPRLDIVFIGNNPASEVYVAMKVAKGEKVGVLVVVHHFDKISDQDLQKLIMDLAANPDVHGIILQLPAPGIDAEAACELIPVAKDVDGLNSASLGRLWHNYNVLIPATARAVLLALTEVATAEGKNVPDFFRGKQVVIMNRSVIIGKPMAAILTNLNATVTLAHSETLELESYLKRADVVISGVGKPGIISADKLKPGVVVIDAGFVKVDGHVMGDVGKNDLSNVASWISPVPNGIGPMGVACLIENTALAAAALNR